jgi:alanine racemase
MLVHGQKAKITGRVCMDQVIVDVSSIDHVQEGDIVTAFGHDGKAFISVNELAAYNDTINYEIVCQISKRVPRIYYKNGAETGTLNYLCR